MNDDKSAILEEDHGQVIAEILSKDWGELRALEHAGYLLFPDTVYKRKSDGELEEIAVCFRVPRQHELRKARVAARRIGAKDGLDPDRDADLISDIETICILSHSIRNAKPPHEPWVPDPEDLEKNYDRSSLMQVWAKIDALHRVIDPSPATLSEKEVLALVSAIAERRSILPLIACAPDARDFCVIFMASRLQEFLDSK